MINKEVVVFQIEDMLSNINKENLLSFGGHIDNGAVFLELMTNVLTLLKEQEPRVLTADELYLMEHKCVYLERRNSQLYLTEPSIVIGTSKPLALCQYKYILMRENKISDVRYSNDYNKEIKSGWRCWSAKPTEERRKEVKWE